MEQLTSDGTGFVDGLEMGNNTKVHVKNPNKV